MEVCVCVCVRLLRLLASVLGSLVFRAELDLSAWRVEVVAVLYPALLLLLQVGEDALLAHLLVHEDYGVAERRRGQIEFRFILVCERRGSGSENQRLKDG